MLIYYRQSPAHVKQKNQGQVIECEGYALLGTVHLGHASKPNQLEGWGYVRQAAVILMVVDLSVKDGLNGCMVFAPQFAAGVVNSTDKISN